MYLPLLVGALCSSLFWYAVNTLNRVLSSFSISLTRKRELVVLLLLSFGCLDTVNILRFFLMVPWVVPQFVIVIFLDHTHFLLLATKAQTTTFRVHKS